MPRFWRWLAGLIIALILLFALTLVIERWRGKRMLEATVAELRARGTLPVPEVLFSPPGPSNGIYLLVSAAERLGSPPAPPSMRMILPGRAVASFERTWWEESRSGSNTWEGLARWNREHVSDLQQLHRALTLPDCRATLDWPQGFKMPLPELAKQKAAVRALTAAALFAARNGDKNGAVTHLAAVRRLEQFSAREPVLISQLVRIAFAAIALPCAWDIAQRDDWSESDLAALQSALPSDNYSNALVESLRGEAALWTESIKNLSPKDYSDFSDLYFVNDPISLPGGVEEIAPFADEVFSRSLQGFRALVLFPIWRFAWRDQAIAFHLRSMNELFERSRAAGIAQNLQNFSEEGIPGLGPMGWYDYLRFHMTRMALPALPKALAKAMRLETERALIETGIALRRYKLRHGDVPEQLTQLTPEFLGNVPMDRMDGKPLRYRRNADGTYTLWSVGEDFVDHDGDVSPINQNSFTLRWWNARDAVLPLPASDAELATWAEQEMAKAKQKKSPSSRSQFPPDLLRRYGLLPATTNESVPRSGP